MDLSLQKEYTIINILDQIFSYSLNKFWFTSRTQTSLPRLSELALANRRVWGRLCMSNWPQPLASRFNSVLINTAGLRRTTKKQGGGWGSDDFVRLLKSGFFPLTLLGWFWFLLWTLFSIYGRLCIGLLTSLPLDNGPHPGIGQEALWKYGGF